MIAVWLGIKLRVVNRSEKKPEKCQISARMVFKFRCYELCYKLKNALNSLFYGYIYDKLFLFVISVIIRNIE